MEIPIEHRDKDIEVVRVALGTAGLHFDYTTADLINSVFALLRRKGEKFTILDGVDVLFEHRKKWEQYTADHRVIEYGADDPVKCKADLERAEKALREAGYELSSDGTEWYMPH